jgi:hypothetical protein
MHRYMDLKHTYEYISFILIDKKPATAVWQVVNIKSGDQLGLVQWYAKWHQYIFSPTTEIILSKGCMEDINSFITEVETQRLRDNFVQHATEFYSTRMTALQEYQKDLPEPYRTEICNILANGRPRP